MKISYHPDTDSLYIDNASRKVQMERRVLTRITAQIERIAG
ncbi:MAG: hypothetical protein ACYC3L_13690 [Gemmatimonadaceae bacterium]